ncbi:E3 ubiquitin-protein ligase, partial [Cucurbita argyrosperma subsp. sororia]
MRVSRARWFIFLRRVFHYQNGSRSDLGSDPFNSSSWMAMELIAMVFQLAITVFFLAISETEKPVWPMRLWIVGYDLGCVLSLLLLYGRYWHVYLMPRVGLPDIEQRRSSQASRSLRLMNKCRSSLELFFAIWFVMGNVWIVDSRFDSFQRAPKLHLLCIFLSLLGYNINMASTDKGASDDQISELPCWRYKASSKQPDSNNKGLPKEDPECCICLVKYRDEEEVRELPCSHLFHLKCVDKWLSITSSCPLCKQQLQR